MLNQSIPLKNSKSLKEILEFKNFDGIPDMERSRSLEIFFSEMSCNYTINDDIVFMWWYSKTPSIPPKFQNSAHSIRNDFNEFRRI